MDSHERSLLAQLRFGILPLHVETGSFNVLPLEERICQMCDANVIENECHFLFECELYNDLRYDWEKTVRIRCPDFLYMEVNDQLTYLFENLARPTAKYISRCFSLRKSVMFN